MKAAFGLALLALAALAFADVGPPPTDMPSITLHALIDGRQVPDGTVVNMHCFVNEEEFRGPGGGGECQGGVCRVSAYKLNPCMREGGHAIFEFAHESFSRNYTTSPLVFVQKGTNYDFNVSISTASGTANIGGEGVPQPFNPCAMLFVLGGAAAAALVAVKR